MPSSGIVLNYNTILKLGSRRHLNKRDMKIRRKLAGMVLSVSRTKHDGSFGDAKPCVMCLYAMHMAGIKKVRYTNDDGVFVNTTVAKLLDEPSSVSGGVRSIFRDAKRTGDTSAVLRLPLPKHVVSHIMKDPEGLRTYLRG